MTFSDLLPGPIVCLFLSFSLQQYLQKDICNKMWNKATNNLNIPSELIVHPAIPARQLFELTSAGALKAAIQEFVSFGGNSLVHGLN